MVASTFAMLRVEGRVRLRRGAFGAIGVLLLWQLPALGLSNVADDDGIGPPTATITGFARERRRD